MSQYESKTGINRILSDAGKQGYNATKNLPAGVNNFLDNSIQPSAARASDRGVSGSHKAPIDVGAETGHSATGPALGTGTAGFSTRDRPTHGIAGAGSSTLGGGTGGTDLSKEAKRVGTSLQNFVGSITKK